MTSQVSSLAIQINTAVWIHAPGLRVSDWALSVAERHCTPFGQYPEVQQRDPDSQIGRGYRKRPWDKQGRADRLQRRYGISREDRLTSQDRSQVAAAFAEQDESQRS